MKVIIAGGGTGGHIFPAISIAEEIKRRNPSNNILFVGTSRGLENDLLSKRGFRIEHIRARGIKGRSLLNSVNAIFSSLAGLFDSLSVIRNFRPDAVLGVGGYVSGPMVLAASLYGIPTAVCEQNVYPGVTNRILGKLVKRVFVAFEDSRSYFPGDKVLLTGNPVRNEILRNAGSEKKAEAVVILVFGGSQGAHRLNASVPEALAELGREDISVIHQTGLKDYDYVKNLYQKFGIKARVLTFIEDMAGAYAGADFVIGRAGAGTVSEITALGKPSLLVPYPHAANNHQMENARVLERAGAAIVIEDKEATPENLSRALTGALGKDKLNSMASAAAALGKPGAAGAIADEISKLGGEI
ncbi:MAG: undecaprenyldiphospho-muramoylpentapeptide beta-N-acetylglucosaminyltransferase [Deltaproteobacteria bacterium]